MIKGIIFDMGGVFTNDVHLASYAQLAKRIGGITVPQLEKESRTEHDELQKGMITELEFWIRVIKKLNKNINPEIMEKLWGEIYKKYSKTNEEVERIVSALKNKYKLALLSNTITSHSDDNKKKGRYSLFDFVVLSHEVGLRKPEKEIYELVLKRLGLKPEECVFTDDIEKYLVPARKMGIKTIHFKNAEQLRRELVRLGVKLR